MVVLASGSSSTKAYLEETDVLPAVELGLEQMLKVCSAADSNQDPINFLASWLMRNNPKHNAAFASLLEARRNPADAEGADAAAAETAVEAAAEAAAEPAAPAADGDTVNTDVDVSDHGKVSLTVSLSRERL